MDEERVTWSLLWKWSEALKLDFLESFYEFWKICSRNAFPSSMASTPRFRKKSVISNSSRLSWTSWVELNRLRYTSTTAYNEFNGFERFDLCQGLSRRWRFMNRWIFLVLGLISTPSAGNAFASVPDANQYSFDRTFSVSRFICDVCIVT